MILVATFISAVAVGVMAVGPTPAHAGTLGCIVGGAGGGAGGSAIGKGKGKTILTIAGALIGCGLGSRIQDNDQQRYQQQPQWQPQYQQRRYRSRYNEFRYPRQVRQANVVYLPAPAQVARAPQAPACDYSREYQTTVIVGGKEVPAHGRACYNPDGTWDLGPAEANR